eukprot:TRINITY_DN3137_c0_g5_i1.p1 TRINITY_DN3137_c0_g5~~TRINITY_DN3137_c0_g5_i1.p1  ORF type:complete len:644 (-),score=196.53 TRINITY_DN3137_c0_g5_i1:43-1974(-)
MNGVTNDYQARQLVDKIKKKIAEVQKIHHEIESGVVAEQSRIIDVNTSVKIIEEEVLKVNDLSDKLVLQENLREAANSITTSEVDILNKGIHHSNNIINEACELSSTLPVGSPVHKDLKELKAKKKNITQKVTEIIENTLKSSEKIEAQVLSLGIGLSSPKLLESPRNNTYYGDDFEYGLFDAKTPPTPLFSPKLPLIDGNEMKQILGTPGNNAISPKMINSSASSLINVDQMQQEVYDSNLQTNSPNNLDLQHKKAFEPSPLSRIHSVDDLTLKKLDAYSNSMNAKSPSSIPRFREIKSLNRQSSLSSVIKPERNSRNSMRFDDLLSDAGSVISMISTQDKQDEILISQLRSENNELQREVISQNTQISRLNQDRNEIEKERSILRSTKVDLEQEITELKTKLNKQEIEAKTLKIANNDLRRQLDTLTNELENNNLSFSTISAENESYQKRLEIVNETTLQQTFTIQDLNSKIEEQSKLLMTLETDLNNEIDNAKKLIYSNQQYLAQIEDQDSKLFLFADELERKNAQIASLQVSLQETNVQLNTIKYSTIKGNLSELEATHFELMELHHDLLKKEAILKQKEKEINEMYDDVQNIVENFDVFKQNDSAIATNSSECLVNAQQNNDDFNKLLKLTQLRLKVD